MIHTPSQMNSLTLSVLPSLKTKRISEGQIVLTQKFIDGMLEYQNYWHDKIKVFIEEDSTITDDLDNIIIDINQLPFEIKIVDFNKIQENREFQDSSIVLATIGYKQYHVAQVCKTYQIPCIYTTEYSLKTRLQIVNSANFNTIALVKKYIGQLVEEKKREKSIAQADGVQCNGTPTYEAYKNINSNPLLYFDTRVTSDMLISEDELVDRTSQCLANKPLRLLFSGRLVAIKGADHLILVAQELIKLQVKFEMFICGDGNLRESMQKQINQNQLSDFVKMLGVLEFKNELIPFVKNNADLFICCHRQGDPSCTYLETLSCGVPIVGYDNEAFVGIVKYSQAGWSVRINQPELIARKISELDKNRQTIVDHSYRALEFARLHTFEKTFSKRINHIKEIIAK